MTPIPIHPLGVAIILAVLSMGLLGLVVVLPIACIQWLWNTLSTAQPGGALLPPINVGQAGLLYLAGATVVYLTGWVQIDISMDTVD